MPPLRKGNGFKRKCSGCKELNSIKSLKCHKCGYEFLNERRERRKKELAKRVAQGKKNRLGNNSTRLITRAKDTVSIILKNKNKT